MCKTEPLFFNRFCVTDMWDEWEEDPDEYYNYRHQRRLSDPSANLNNFTRYGWRAKGGNDGPGGIGVKARSENEGLDTMASEVSEIEAGDLRDGMFMNPLVPVVFCRHVNCFHWSILLLVFVFGLFYNLIYESRLFKMLSKFWDLRKHASKVINY